MPHNPFDRKIDTEGQPCRKCGTPVERRDHSKKPPRRGNGGYYFEWWFRCPNCGVYYLVEAAKRYYKDGDGVGAAAPDSAPRLF